MIRLLVLVLALGLPAWVAEAAVAASESECVAQGGKWTSYFEATPKYCHMPIKDQGKACHSRKDCQSQCVAKTGTDTSGTCANTQDTIMNGGYELDENGVNQPLPIM